MSTNARPLSTTAFDLTRKWLGQRPDHHTEGSNRRSQEYYVVFESRTVVLKGLTVVLKRLLTLFVSQSFLVGFHLSRELSFWLPTVQRAFFLASSCPASISLWLPPVQRAFSFVFLPSVVKSSRHSSLPCGSWDLLPIVSLPFITKVYFILSP